MIGQMDSHADTKTQAGRRFHKPDRSSSLAQPVFVGTFVFIALSVAVEYALGDFAGLNAGEDFGLVIGGTMLSGICVGVIAGAIHDWIRHAKND
ncbi:hypothetical protein [Taklimakanibacter lacteus]|uniref:hypothetical protein n=1 Tax=Taklimakanibacter lacteus TaxID=2268456 RepID=UPI000E66CECE